MKKDEISKNDFSKYATQKIAETTTNVLFALFSVPCLFIPIPFLGCLISICLTVIGIGVSKLVSWAIGKAWDELHERCLCCHSIS